MSEHPTADETHLDDPGLVELVRSALVDPNLHTDTRMRLHWQITRVVHDAHEEVHGEASPADLQRHGDRVHDLLAEVLVDPNLHTQTRMRLHREIGNLIAAAGHAGAAQPTAAS